MTDESIACAVSAGSGRRTERLQADGQIKGARKGKATGSGQSGFINQDVGI